MSEKRQITMEVLKRQKDRVIKLQAVPLKLMISVQNGRRYLMAYLPEEARFRSFRRDSILSIA